MRVNRRLASITTAFALAAASLGLAQSAEARPRPTPNDIELQVLSFNDFHGHLQPPTGTDATLGTTLDPSGTLVGGAEYLSTKLTELRQGARSSHTVAAGDLIGGSPFLSGLFHDEPAVESLNAMGLDVSSVGNHEFDEGVDELLRMQRGGCHPEDGCYIPWGEEYPGADFRWLAANVVRDSTGRTILPGTMIKKVRGVKVGYIGMTLEATPALVAQSGIQGIDFRDEVETANRAARELQAARRRDDHRAAARGRLPDRHLPAVRRHLGPDRRHRREPASRDRPRRHRAHPPALRLQHPRPARPIPDGHLGRVLRPGGHRDHAEHQPPQR